MVIPYGELLIDVYVKCFGKSVNEVVINNPGLGKVNSAMFGNLFRENWLVQYSFLSTLRDIPDKQETAIKKPVMMDYRQ